MQTSRKPTAYLCQCGDDATVVEQLLINAGFDVAAHLFLPAIVQHLSGDDAGNTDLIVSSVQEGGLAVAAMLDQLDLSSDTRLVLVDHHGDVSAAIKALRLHVADYLLLSESVDHLVGRLRQVNERIKTTRIETVAVPAAPPQSYASAYGSSSNGHGRVQETMPGHIWWDSTLCAIRSEDMWVPLSPIEWKLFERLVNKRGAVVSTEDLIESALHRTSTNAADTSLLRLHVSRLRAKLNEHFSQDLSIVTMRGRGYMLV